MWYKNDWLDNLRSMWQSCSNLLNRWSHFISELVGTKLMLVFGGWFWKLANIVISVCRNPTLEECEDDTHTPEMGTWESSGTPKNSEFDCRGQNTSTWGVLYIAGKVLKCRYRKWPYMSHSNIYNTSYGQKKGRESNWQFDSRPLKVENRLDPGVWR
jgi:hypothetical protein